MSGPVLHLVVPGPLDQRTGGYLYDARMVEGLRRRGWEVVVHALDGAFPDADHRARVALARTLAALPDDARVVVDGLALGGLPGPLRSHAHRLRIVGLVHHPLADETGIEPWLRDRLASTEREALAACTGVVVTSPFTAARLGAYGVAPERVRTVCPGTEAAEAAGGPAPGEPPLLLCVASVTPRKGQDVLMRALGRLRHLPWRCVCAGSLARDPTFADRVREGAVAERIEERVDFVGELDADALAALYHRASLLVLPSHYEGYGMVLSEALARGLPVVSTTGGAIPSTVPDDAAVLVPPGDAAALAGALLPLLAPDAGGGAAGHPGRRRPPARRGLARLERGRRRLRRSAPGAHPGGGHPMTAPPDGGTFDAGWLALREPTDHRSRADGPLLDPLRAAWTDGGWSRVLDLGSGTGSNLRWLSPRLPRPQAWTLVDHDAALLERAVAPGEDVTVTRVVGDLAEEGLAAVPDAHLVTASALLDLAGGAWLQALAAACRDAGAAVLFALTYDGQMRFTPASGGVAIPGALASDPDDAWVRDAVNAHQRRDKGLGPALGPSAAPAADVLFRQAGYDVWLRSTPWRLTADDAELAVALVDGWAAAAEETRPGETVRVRRWAARRRGDLATGRAALTVGHVDLLALPR